MFVFPAFFCKAVALFLVGLYSVGLPVKIRGRALSGRITVTAHSGCMDLPDNSIEAMESGVRAGARIVEFDLQFSADGTPVLSHNVPDPETSYVTLEDAFAFLAKHPGVQANVDVKSTAYLEKVPTLAEQAGVTERIFFTGIRENDVATVREKCPGIPYYLNTDVSADEDLNALAEKTASLGAVGVNLYWEYTSPELVNVFHKHKMPVSVWTVDDAEETLRLAVYGVDNITSRRPDIVCERIR